MTTDGTYTAVVDRFEDDLAVLLLEADNETIGERVLDRDRLPADGRHVDAVLAVEFVDDAIVGITYADEETADRSAQAQERFDDLSQRPPESDEEESDSS